MYTLVVHILVQFTETIKLDNFPSYQDNIIINVGDWTTNLNVLGIFSFYISQFCVWGDIKIVLNIVLYQV